MLAFRLLGSYPGSPWSQGPGVPLEVFTDLNVPTAGALQPFTNPPAFYLNGKTYFSYITKAGTPAARSYDNTTGVQTIFPLHTALEKDLHDVPAIWPRPSDDRIMALYSKHSGNQMQIRISTNPDDVSAFGAEAGIDTQLGGHAYTYPNLVYLPDEAGSPLYLFYRDYVSPTGSWCYSKNTTPGLTGWSVQTIVYRNSGVISDLACVGDGSDIIHFAVTNGRTAATEKLGHFYSQGGSYYKSDGTLIAHALPITFADVTEIQTAVDVYPRDIALDATGKPVIVTEYKAGTDDFRYAYHRWDGAAWVSNQVGLSGTGVDLEIGGGAKQAAGVTLEHSDPSVVYHSDQVAGTGGTIYEMFRSETSDLGDSFTSEAITENSTYNNLWPRCVRDSQPELRLIWNNGPIVDYTNYSVGIWGARDG